MLKQGFASDIDVVDEWKKSNVSDFYDFCDGREIAVGDDEDGRCTFRALFYALEHLGNTEWYATGIVDEFCTQSCRKGFPVCPTGVTWNSLYAFVRFGNNIGKGVQISTKVFRLNCLVDTIRTETELDALPLADGVYVCSAFTSNRRGHAFCLSIISGTKFVTDSENRHVPLSGYGHWIAGVLYIRRVELFQN
jgi:hypothetical protein